MKRKMLVLTLLFLLRVGLSAEPCMVTAYGVDAGPVFSGSGFKKSGILVTVIKQRKLKVPADSRFKKMETGKFLERVAEFNNMKVFWNAKKTGVVLYRGAAEDVVKEVLQGLSSSDEKVLRTASWRARWLEDVRVLEPLAALCLHKNPAISAQAWDGILDLGITSAGISAGGKLLPVIEASLKDKDVTRRREAVRALKCIGSDEALSLSAKACLDEDASVRLAAVEGLGFFPGKKAEGLAAKAHEDTDDAVRASAVEAEMSLAPEKAVEIAGTVLKGADTLSRRSVIKKLGETGGAAALDLVEKSFKDGDAWVARAAALELGEFSDDRALRLLSGLLEHDDPWTKRNAIYALGHIGGEKSFNIIKGAISDKDAWIRRAVVSAFAWTGGPEAVAEIEKALDDEDQWVRATAITMLGEIGGKRAVTLLKKSQSKDKDLQFSVITALGCAGGEEAGKVLLKIMSEWSKQENSRVVMGFAWLPEEEALPLLKQAMSTGNGRLITDSLTVCADLAGDGKWELLEAAAGSKEGGIRLSIVAVLEKIGTENAMPLLEKLINTDDPIWRAYLIRYQTVLALRKLGGEMARDILMARLPVEQDKNNMTNIRSILYRFYRNDPGVAEAVNKYATAPAGGKK